MFKKKQPLSFQEVLSKLMSYCSYQERSPFEVKQKLKDYNLPPEKVDEIMDILIQDDFINEKRFGEIYVRSKINTKRWGVYKIKAGLAVKGLNAEAVTLAVQTIDKEKYRENLNYLLERKIELQPNLKNETTKIYRYLQSKGYESELISNAIKTYLNT